MPILLHGHEDYERAWHLMRSENAHLAVCSTIKQVWLLAKANTAELEVLVFEHESSQNEESVVAKAIAQPAASRSVVL